MKKKILFIIIIFILIISGGIIYLNNILLPTKIKSLLIQEIQGQTEKKADIGSLHFNIFKGLVLKNLSIYDNNQTIFRLKEASCAFLILPIFRRMIIIPSLNLNSAEVFLERRKDNTFNIQELFIHKTVTGTAAQPKKGFSIFVYRLNAANARIRFQDDTFAAPFSKNIEILNLNARLSLPGSIKLNLMAEIPGAPVININVSGEFKISRKELMAKVSLQNISPKEFSVYYQNSGVNITGGLLNSLMDIKLKDDMLYITGNSQSRNLTIVKEKVSLLLNSDITTNMQYDFKNGDLSFSGKAAIVGSQVKGIEFAGDINGINGELTFNNAGVVSDKLSASVWGMPIQAKLSLSDFSNPLLNINISSSLNLDSLKGILKDKFEFILPGEIKGESNLFLAIQTRIPQTGSLMVNGCLDILNAFLKLEKVSSPIENINGKLEFSPDKINWQELNFKYMGVSYKTTGSVSDFRSPQVKLALASKELSLDSSFAVNDKLFKFSKFSGRYLNSDFAFIGDMNASSLETNMGGKLNVDLQDTKELLKKFKTNLEQIKPLGLMQVELNLDGNISNIKSCAIQAKLSSPSISLYGLKTNELLINYIQRDGIVDIPVMNLSLYEGKLLGSAKINLNSENLPFWVNTDIQGVKIEKLKLDTAAKEQDIAGIISSQFKLNGFFKDISRINGAGNIFITEGRLWQLNLFKGLGSLLFAKDFANIVFQNGSCNFIIQDKNIFSDDLKLESNIASLSGTVKIGFDSSIDASLNVQVLDEMAPLSGTFKDITTAVIGQAGRFGVIKIGGTLKEPKYKFKPAVADIIKGLKEAIFGK